MIIVRIPLRLSFAGGGSDLKAFYEKEDGMVIRRLRRFSQIKKKKDERTDCRIYRSGWEARRRKGQEHWR